MTRRAESPRPRYATSAASSSRMVTARPGHDDRVAVRDRLLGRERERRQRAGEGALGQRLLRLERGRPSRRGAPPRRRSGSEVAPTSGAAPAEAGSASAQRTTAARRRMLDSSARPANDLKAWRGARSAPAAVRLRGLDRPLRRLRARPGDGLARRRDPPCLRRPRAADRGGAGRRRRHRRTTSRWSSRSSTSSALPFDLEGFAAWAAGEPELDASRRRRSPASGRRSRSTRSRPSSPRSRRSRSRSSRRRRSGAVSSSATASPTSTRTRSRPASVSRRRRRTSCSASASRTGRRSTWSGWRGATSISTSSRRCRTRR